LVQTKNSKSPNRLSIRYGLPNLGGGKPLNIDEANAAATLRASLNISKDEFVISKLQDRLRLGQDDDLSIRCFFSDSLQPAAIPNS
jgi:hypothetical protein